MSRRKTRRISKFQEQDYGFNWRLAGQPRCFGVYHHQKECYLRTAFLGQGGLVPGKEPLPKRVREWMTTLLLEGYTLV